MGMLEPMSTIGQIGDGNLLVSSVTIASVAPIQPALQTAYAQFETDNASILAASLGLGTTIDIWA
jgi:hypothetical protein